MPNQASAKTQKLRKKTLKLNRESIVVEWAVAKRRKKLRVASSTYEIKLHSIILQAAYKNKLKLLLSIVKLYDFNPTQLY